jgi:hypothetical protein
MVQVALGVVETRVVAVEQALEVTVSLLIT